MSNPQCGKCGKTVYPVEKLSCLDKFWHKGCFRCEVCQMALTMKNFNGFDKMPYCRAHMPTTKPTSVVDTPENLRLKKQSEIISNIKYHSDFEKGKGKVLSVTDDPETMRIKKNTGFQSLNMYHGHTDAKYMMEAKRPVKDTDGIRQPRQAGRNPGSLEDYDPIKDLEAVSKPPRMVGSIDNYNPLASESSTRTTSYKASSQPPPQRYQPPRQDAYQPPPPAVTSYTPYQPPPPQVQHYEPPPPPVETYRPPPVETYRPPPVETYTPPPVETYTPPPVETYNPPPKQSYAPPPVQAYVQPTQPPQKSRGLLYRAIYDYTAAEPDEVTFVDGDVLINCEIIDAGWMSGTNERTGDTGMLPSNYVEPL